MVELVDTLVLGTSAVRRGGSIPSIPTIFFDKNMRILSLLFAFLITPLMADEGDILFTRLIELDKFAQSKTSYCKPRTQNKKLTWVEDFNDMSLSSSVWTYAESNGFYSDGQYIDGWGNGELQYYLKPPIIENSNTTKNLTVKDSLLKIQPIYNNKVYQSSNKLQYTSARIHTKNKKTFTYPSRITICFKVPQGEGVWPAFWLMPQEDILWPQGGEIDIMEHRGRIANTASSALHFGEKFDKKAAFVGEAVVPNKVNFQETFHSITLEWRRDNIKFFLNDDTEPYLNINSSNNEFKKYDFPFNREYYMILNVAIGGKYDDYRVNNLDLCVDQYCSNKSNPDQHRFLVDWIEYEVLD